MNVPSELAALLPDGASEKDLMEEFAAFAEHKTRDAVPSPGIPLLLNISGIPGSGKTTMAARLLAEYPSLVYISFDELMEALPGYRADLLERGAPAAFTRWEAPARLLGYRLLEECVARRLSILFEHSNADPRHVSLYRSLKEAGYRIEIRFLDTDEQTALARTRQRARAVPPTLIATRAALLRTLKEEYRRLADHFETIKT
jgi:predicted kinase